MLITLDSIADIASDDKISVIGLTAECPWDKVITDRKDDMSPKPVADHAAEWQIAVDAEMPLQIDFPVECGVSDVTIEHVFSSIQLLAMPPSGMSKSRWGVLYFRYLYLIGFDALHTDRTIGQYSPKPLSANLSPRDYADVYHSALGMKTRERGHCWLMRGTYE